MSRRHFPPEGEVRHVQGRNGARDIVLHVAVPHGKTTRDVTVPLEPSFILALAEAINCCPAQIGEWEPTGSVLDGTYLAHGVWRPHVYLGHAVWHLEHPEAVRPCLPRNTTIIETADETRLAAPVIDATATEES